MDYVDLYSANRDPSVFEGPNTFNMSRKDWMHNVAWGSPLWAYYKSASNVNPECRDDNPTACIDTDPEVLATDENGEYILDMDKAMRIRKRWCPAYFHSRIIIEDLVDLFLKKIEDEEAAKAAAKQPVCTNRQTEAMERFGVNWFNQIPTADICTWAMARIDVRLGRGVGCAKHGGDTGICCATCAQPGLVNTQDYTNIMRMVALKNMREEVFTALTPAEWNYFLLTQKYYNDESVLSVTIVGVDKPYVGARSILEYYTLQVAGFSPRSHRHFGVRYENNSDVFVPVTGNQMQLLNMNPQVNNGLVQQDNDALWSDFAHFIWEGDDTVTPLKKAFVDFRYPNVFPIDSLRTITAERVGAALPLLNTFGNTWDLCQLLHQRCYHKNQQFESVDQCMHFMKKLPDHKLGYCPIFAGNTKACRFMHSILAQDILDPDFHCFHMGPNKPDPNGNVKCSDADCGHETQGPLECDEDGCRGTLMHSGDVVEWMFTIYHILAFVWTVYVYFGLRAMRRCDGLSAATLQKIAQAEAVTITLFFVFLFMALVHIICQAAQPTFLWRPPPLQSLEMRYSEVGDPQHRFREYNYAGSEYEGQYTEPTFGAVNGFIADHLVYLLMFTGFEMCCLIFEWSGYEYYYNSTSTNRMRAMLPEIGHICFVVFVALAYTMPPSAFSGLLFLIGITQGGHPEMMLQSFNASALVHTELKEEPEEDDHRKSVLRRRSFNARSAVVHSHQMVWSKMSWMEFTETILQRMSAVGVCLHHMSMVCVYLGYSLHILYTPDRMLFTGVRVVIFLVLVQHLISQLFGTGKVGLALLITTEYFFQHFTISYMGEAGSLLLTTSCFKLLMSHWFMMPIMVWAAIKPLLGHKEAVAGANLVYGKSNDTSRRPENPHADECHDSARGEGEPYEHLRCC